MEIPDRISTVTLIATADTNSQSFDIASSPLLSSDDAKTVVLRVSVASLEGSTETVLAVGKAMVGFSVGTTVGSTVGSIVGSIDGSVDGDIVGINVGSVDGNVVGSVDGG